MTNIETNIDMELDDEGYVQIDPLEIKRIQNLENDNDFKKAIDNLIYNNAYDERGYPKNVKIDEYNFLKPNDPDYGNDKNDPRSPKNIRLIIFEYNNNRTDWENYFILLDDLLAYYISDMEKNGVKYRDISIKEFYEKCKIDIRDGDISDFYKGISINSKAQLTDQNKADIKRAIFTLIEKYPEFSLKRGTEYRIEIDILNKFIIEPNSMFYDTLDEFKTKKYLKRFLINSKKVYIHPDICLIPVKYKEDRNSYVLVADNHDQTLQMFQLNSLGYFNSQSNIYEYIEMNCNEEFLEEFKKFKRYLIKKIKKYSVINKKTLYEIYKANVTDFKEHNNIINQFR